MTTAAMAATDHAASTEAMKQAQPDVLIVSDNVPGFLGAATGR